MPTNTDVLKKVMLKAMEKNMGLVTHAAKEAGIHRSTHYDWYNADKEYKKAVDSLQDMVIDFAESKLYKNIEDKKETSIIFYLKTKAKHRGYIERIDNVTHNINTDVDIKKAKELLGGAFEVIDEKKDEQ